MAQHELRYLVAGAMVLWWGCSADPPTPPPDPPEPVASVEVTAPATTMTSLGETIQLTAVARDAAGNAIGTAAVSWTSSEPTFASVSGTGLVTAIANGAVTVTASSDGVSGSVDLTVNQIATALAFTSSPGNTEAGQTLLPAIGVEARDARDNTAANFTDDITVGLDANPGSGTLAGTTTVTAAAGVAAFTDLAIDAAAAGYTLGASATGLTAATSQPFEITPQPQTVTWTGTTGGNWSDGANWSGGTAPSSVDKVQITTDGTYTVTIDADVTIGDLTIGAATGSQTVAIDGVELTVTGSLSLGANGVLGGDGTLDVSTATSTQIDGTIAPGSSPGILTVVGDLVLTAASELLFEIGGTTPGTDHDQLIVTGDVTFDGKLTGQFINAYAPAQGTRFDIMTYANGTGQFATVALPSQLSLDMQSTALDFEATAAPSAAWDQVTANNYSCGLIGSDAYCWGGHPSGGLGNGTSGANGYSNVPVPVSGGHAFQAVATGSNYACGITAQGAALCWGDNSWGQLGDNGTPDQTTPVAVTGGHTFVSIGAGVGHTCGLTTTGETYCWGTNFYGQFGDGNSGSSEVTNRNPVLAAGGMTFASLSVGAHHTCWLDANGGAYCAGQNSEGEIGSGSSATEVTNPEAVSGGLAFTSISAGWQLTCGVATNGSAHCWGGNDFGQLGDGTFTNSNVPVAVSGGHTFTAVSAGTSGGSHHACGIVAGGNAHCWGDNAFAALGDGTKNSSNVPVAVQGGLSVIEINAGNAYACVITVDDEAYCWGTGGSLGNGTYLESTVPARVTDPT